MDKLAEIFRVNRRLDSEYQAADSLIRDAEVIKGLRFLTELDSLAAKYQFEPRDILVLLRPELADQQGSMNATNPESETIPKLSKPSSKKNERPIKRYRNPRTGEVLETRGANNGKLKQWKSEFGAELVESWRY
ncbi:histone-like nucleoid-structuring protein, MvaT/MvaU family [Pseudomonas sp. s4]|uniref:histone-like nucleoid-structuring protein, MvaT/MvaU family n=1 Tax=Pseudomonas sp. s4 TaxID=353218 RepID=UPI00398C8993